jgi:hypothetical protein
MFALDASAEAIFRFGIPVAVLEFDEYGRVREGGGGADDEDVEVLSGRFEEGEDGFLVEFGGFVGVKGCVDIISEFIDTGREVVFDGTEFTGEVDFGADVLSLFEGGENVVHDFRDFGIGIDLFDTGAAVSGEGGFCDDDPVAVSELVGLVVDGSLPIAVAV